MTMLRAWRTALLGGLTAAAALAGPAGAMPPSGEPTAEITNMQTRPGQVQFLLSVTNLPAGASLDPASVTASAEGTTLDATASLGGTRADKKTRSIRETVLALDASGSMKGDGIAAARAAALAYARSLPSDVRVGLVAFNERSRVLLKPTSDRKALAAAVGEVAAGGDTALYDGVLTAAALMEGLPADAERRLLILSDGDDTSSTHSLAEAADQLSVARIPADVVAFRLPGDRSALTTIATQSHGRVLPAANAGELADVFSEAASVFSQQLVVTANVPAALADQEVTLKVTANAGDASVATTTSLTLPAAPGAPANGGPPRASAPAAASATSNAQLWTVVALAFLGIFVAVGVALYLPVMSHARAQRQSRLAELQRYRVLGALGTNAAFSVDMYGGPSATQGALAQRALSVVDRTVRARGQRERLVGELDRAGMRMRPEEWAIIQLAAVLATGVVLFLLSGSVIGLIAGLLLGWGAARMFIRIKISRRKAKFADQLPETLQLLASALRTGFSLNQALGGVVREGGEPTASEFARALTEVRIGADLEDAVDDVADRMECDDLRWVVMAVRISREVGGNLAEVLQTTVHTMRQRAELRRQVRVLSAEGRISARVLTSLPFAIAGALSLVRPGYLKPLVSQPAGIAMLCLGAVLLTLGSFWLSRLVKIKV